MRIAFFSDNFYPELSGIVDSILITGEELRRRGHEVCFIGPRYTEREYRMVGLEAPKSDDDDQYRGMPFVRLPSLPLVYSPTGQSRLALPTGASFAYLDAFKPDILHAHSPYGAGLEALRAARRYRIPLMGTNHTAIEEFYPFAPEAMRRFDVWYYNHCSFITAPYPLLLERMREKGLARPTQALPNPIELPLYYPLPPAEKEALKAELGLPGPVILYTGRLAIEKRVDEVMRAVAKIAPDFPALIFVAAGHGAEGRKLKKLAHALGIEKNVRLVGFIERAQLLKYYQAADAFAIMSTSDSQSLALMQAFAAGLPAVGARSRGLPHYLPPECGYLVEPGDIDALARRLRELLLDASLRARMGASGMEFVKQFSPAAVAAAWERLYAAAISPRP